ncbi:phosducin [Colletotrichum tofieldiae]|nr:phosducin [Colletotrichum tofieldiae]
MPLVSQHSTVHFVKVHYLDIEFDNAAVPAILAYRNQGDMIANLTGIIEMIPDDEMFGTDTLARLFHKHDIL